MPLVSVEVVCKIDIAPSDFLLQGQLEAKLVNTRRYCLSPTSIVRLSNLRSRGPMSFCVLRPVMQPQKV